MIVFQFWIRVHGVIGAWSNVFHHGSHNMERSPAVFIYPGYGGSDLNWRLVYLCVCVCVCVCVWSTEVKSCEQSALC